MAKAADAFRTISEVADDLGIPKHVLRFWENRFPQIRPMKRGGGRRYYRPEDVELLRGIKQLLHAKGFTIKGVQRILREEGVERVKSVGRDIAEGHEVAVLSSGMPLQRLRRRGGRAAPRRARGSIATIAGIIRELEACRALLRSSDAKPQSQRRRKRG
jgi:DNA-binding transcriptional MerR regulator